MTNFEMLTRTAAIGVGATAVMDAWALLRRLLFDTPLPNYAFVGRWIGHFPRGRFRHERIADVSVVAGERWIGWAAHYLIGIAFAFALVAIVGADWLLRPTLGPAALFGVITVAAPFLLMQPGMGLGIAASRAARPMAARFQSLVTHAVFGFGLYLAAASIR